MKIHHYDPTGIYLKTTDARESPREPGVYLVPSMATMAMPPETLEGQVAVFDTVTNTWSTKSSVKGKPIWEIATGKTKLCDTDLLPSDGKWTDKEPIPGGTWDTEKQDWIVTDESYATELARSKELLIFLIRETRNEKRDGGLTLTDGVTLNTSISGRTALQGAIQDLLASGEKTLDWQAKNQWVTADLATLQEYDRQIGIYTQACFTACRVHEEYINNPALNKIEDVRNYDYRTGWPEQTL